MTHNELSANTKTHLRFLQILYGALVVSTVLYWVVLQMIVTPKESPLDVSIVYMLGAGAGMEALGILFLRFSVMARLLQPEDTANQQSADDHLMRLGALRFWYIIVYTLTESVALMGFVAGFLNGDAYQAVPFFAVAFVLFALCYPQVPPYPTRGVPE
jgi:hypothetical protein